MSLRCLRLYYETLRHLRPWQILGRVLSAAKTSARIPRMLAVPKIRGAKLNTREDFVRHDPWNVRYEILEGRFTFLNETRDLGRPVRWSADEAPLLWQYNLHYFQYLHLLDSSNRDALCIDWMEANPVGQGVGWRPYPLALRIIYWCRSGLSHPRLLESLYQQAAYLYRHLETYHPGNHLLENARALVYSGLLFEGIGEADVWLDRGLEIYRRETPDQVLSDGGYFERTPMYHALMLEGYLDLINILPNNHPDREYLLETARGMSDFLASVTHPDGQVPLFNDATQEIAPPTSELLQYAQALLGREPTPRCVFDDSGYFVARDKDVHIVIDGGKVAPDYLPAHAHADIFSYELSLCGEQVVTDTGVYEYKTGPMRSFVRSTRAHNTVTVDDHDQAECWHSFRVARRYDPRDVRFEEVNGVSFFEGTFDGYAHLVGDGIVHQRRITVDRESKKITVTDRIEGRGAHRVASRIHLHPDAVLHRHEWVAAIYRGAAVCRIEMDRIEGDHITLSVEQGWYCPRFGVRQERDVIVLGGNVQLPLTLKYTLSY